MKLIIAIINHDDAKTVTQALTKNGFSSTKLATTGGFLMAGNATILVGRSAAIGSWCTSGCRCSRTSGWAT